MEKTLADIAVGKKGTVLGFTKGFNCLPATIETYEWME